MTSNQPWWLTWPVAEVAAAILPLFSSSAYGWETTKRASIVNWCKTGSVKSTFAGNPFNDPDHRAIAEAMQVLQYAGLLLRWHETDQCLVGLSRTGWQALQTNTVRQHLGLGDAAPGGGTHDQR
jgi:hypothetical protein